MSVTFTGKELAEKAAAGEAVSSLLPE